MQHGCCLDPDPTTGRGPRALLGVGRTLDQDTGELAPNGRAMVFARRCMTWACFCCAVTLRKRVQARVFRGAKVPGRLFMMTLTIDPRSEQWRRFRASELAKEPARMAYHAGKGASWDERWTRAVTKASLRYVAQSWNRMATYMRRDSELAGLLAVGQDGRAVVPFHKSAELQKNGRAHLHVLVRVPTLADGFRYRRRLRELAVQAGFGGDVERGRGMGFDMQAARSTADLARYVSKGVKLASYVVKASDLMPRYTRRFSWSSSWSDWTRPTRLAGLWDWRLAGGGRDVVARALERSGFVIEDPASFRVVAAGGPTWAPSAGGA